MKDRKGNELNIGDWVIVHLDWFLFGAGIVSGFTPLAQIVIVSTEGESGKYLQKDVQKIIWD